MTINELVYEMSLGGPGLRAFAYKADEYCTRCGMELVRSIPSDILCAIKGASDPLFQDTEYVPQPVFFGDDSQPHYCAKCGSYLYGVESSTPETDPDEP